jgi:hypothetical protein
MDQDQTDWMPEERYQFEEKCVWELRMEMKDW